MKRRLQEGMAVTDGAIVKFEMVSDLGDGLSEGRLSEPTRPAR